MYGKETSDCLINVDYQYEDIKISGVIGKPEIARSNKSYQMFFVNKRYIKDKTLTSSAEQAFKGLLPIGKFGFLILNLQMDPRKIDVNVHPTKLEIRFQEEQKVFKAVYHAIRDSLLKADLIKNAEEANNANTLDKHWEWFTNTMLSRLELGGKIIIIMTRWHSKDLAGRILKWCKENKKKYKHICMKAKQDDGTMLCDEILDNKAYEDKKTAIGADIFSANYQQEPIDIKGKLYSSIKTYDKLPVDNEGNLLFDGIYCYTDTADEGDDYLCSIIWGTYLKEAYILDLIYTKENMEITEPMVAKMINEYKPQKARIESNNGGRGFARNVRRILQEELGNYFTDITWFHQSKNKKSRILTNSTWIMNHIYFPQNWNIKYPDFFESINSYQKEGKNAHDDAEDALTGVSETMHMINN